MPEEGGGVGGGSGLVPIEWLGRTEASARAAATAAPGRNRGLMDWVLGFGDGSCGGIEPAYRTAFDAGRTPVDPCPLLTAVGRQGTRTIFRVSAKPSPRSV